MLRRYLRNAALIRLVTECRAVASVEFAITSLAIFAFLMVLLNLALLGLSVGTLSRATQATARAAAVASANYYETNSSFDCNVSNTTSYSGISSLFNNFSLKLLPTSGTASGSNPLITASWYNTPSTTTTGALPPGVALVLTSQYVWHPVGFAKLAAGITLKITTVATVMGTATGSPAISADCGGTS